MKYNQNSSLSNKNFFGVKKNCFYQASYAKKHLHYFFFLLMTLKKKMHFLET